MLHEAAQKPALVQAGELMPQGSTDTDGAGPVQAGLGVGPGRSSQGSLELHWPQDTELCPGQGLGHGQDPPK